MIQSIRTHLGKAALSFRVNKQIYFLLSIRAYVQNKIFPGRNFILQIIRTIIHWASGCDFSAGAVIPPSTRFPHPTGIVIGEGVRLGLGVTIYQNVTLGSHGRLGKPISFPIIGDDSTIFAGAVLIGGITVGRNCVIGANSVLMTDVKDGSIAVGSPARIISTSKIAQPFS